MLAGLGESYGELVRLLVGRLALLELTPLCWRAR